MINGWISCKADAGHTRLRREMRIQGVRISAVAEAAGASKTAVQTWMAGANVPSATRAVAVASLLGCQVGELWRPIRHGA